jgi:hypothetical protein
MTRVFLILALLCFGCDNPQNIMTNAKQHAELLGLKNPMISCDPGTCLCTISWESCFIGNEAKPQCGRLLANFNCCKSGCSNRN